MNFQMQTADPEMLSGLAQVMQGHLVIQLTFTQHLFCVREPCAQDKKKTEQLYPLREKCKYRVYKIHQEMRKTENGRTNQASSGGGSKQRWGLLNYSES